MTKKRLSTESAPMRDIAQAVLDDNFSGDYTMPSRVLYPHQWLWDSCFHAIGLRHTSPERAAKELEVLLQGQWQNGMVPHMIFSSATHDHNRYNIWKSHICDSCVVGRQTSAITQPPVIGWALEKVIDALPKKDQITLIKRLLPQIIRYHQWLYTDRDPDRTGRVAIIHPLESGFDNNPALMNVMSLQFPATGFERIMLKSGLISLIQQRLRRDTKYTGPNERTTDLESWMAGRLIARYRQKLYNIEAILFDKHSFVVEDISFNSILIRSNQSLRLLAKKAKITIPPELEQSMVKSELALASFWHEKLGLYVSRDWRTGNQIPVKTVAGLLPLATGNIPTAHRRKLLAEIANGDFAAPWPVPTNALNNNSFNPIRYWQGPTWVNINWMLIEGLTQSRHSKAAAELRKKTCQLIEQSGIWEYYNPLDASGHGINSFSWTAALYLDLIRQDT